MRELSRRRDHRARRDARPRPHDRVEVPELAPELAHYVVFSATLLRDGSEMATNLSSCRNCGLSVLRSATEEIEDVVRAGLERAAQLAGLPGKIGDPELLLEEGQRDLPSDVLHGVYLARVHRDGVIRCLCDDLFHLLEGSGIVRAAVLLVRGNLAECTCRGS